MSKILRKWKLCFTIHSARQNEVESIPVSQNDIYSDTEGVKEGVFFNEKLPSLVDNASDNELAEVIACNNSEMDA